MSKEPHKISSIGHQLPLFDPQEGYRADYLLFLQSDMGRLWQKIPFDGLADSVTKRLLKQGVHVPSWGYVDIRGGIALEVLKHYYSGLSDAKLIELINHSKALQCFTVVLFYELGSGRADT